MEKGDSFNASGNSEFQLLSLGESVSRVCSVYKTGFVVLNKITLLTMGSLAILWAFFLLLILPAAGVDGSRLVADDPEYLQEHMGAFGCLLFMKLLLSILILHVGHPAMIRAAADTYIQRQSSVRSYINVALTYWCSNILASILAGCGVFLGLILLVVPGIYVANMWYLVHATITIESLGCIAGLQRSWNLVSGRWCYVFCVVLVAVIPFYIVNHIWLALVAPPVFTFFGSIVSIIPTLVFGPIFAILVTVIYINLRVEKEGLNAESLTRSLNGDSEAELVTTPEVQGSPIV